MLVDVLVSFGQFQRDLQNELTRDGLHAGWAKGNISGRRPRHAQLGVTDQIRRSYRDDGTSIAALAREHGVSRVVIRTAIADLLPNQPDQPAPAAATVTAIRVEIPGKVASHLTGQADLGEAEQHALRRGRTVRRGQGYSLHVTALPDVHHALLAAAASLDAEGASSADRKAYRIYHDRLRLAVQLAVARRRPARPAGPQQIRRSPASPAADVVTVALGCTQIRHTRRSVNRSPTR